MTKMNFNRKNYVNSNNHKLFNDSYDQENGHPNYGNELSLDDNGRDSLRYLT